MCIPPQLPATTTIRDSNKHSAYTVVIIIIVVQQSPFPGQKIKKQIEKKTRVRSRIVHGRYMCIYMRMYQWVHARVVKMHKSNY